MRILITILFILTTLFVVNAQVPTSFRGTLNIYQSSGTAPNYEIRGIFNDTQSAYTSDSVDVGDVIYLLDGSNCVALTVSSIISTSGGVIRANVNDADTILSSAPLGNAAIMELTPNFSFPTYVDGISDDLLSCIQTHYALLVDGIDIPEPSQSGNTQDTITQNSHGFAVLDPLFVNNSGTWILSNVSDEDSIHMGIVTEVINSNTFIITYSGITEQIAHGYTIGSVYYVQDDGTYATTSPANLINDIAFYVVSANKLFITEQRPVSPTIDLNGIYSSSDTIPSGTISTAANWIIRGDGFPNYYISFNPDNDVILIRGDSVLLALGLDGFVITDLRATKKGAQYAANGYVTTATSLADKAYVDAAAAAASVADGDKGDITVSGSGATWNIDADAVGSAEIATGAVTSTEILDNTITTTDLAFTPITGNAASSQLAVYTGTSTIGGYSTLTYNGSSTLTFNNGGASTIFQIGNASHYFKFDPVTTGSQLLLGGTGRILTFPVTNTTGMVLYPSSESESTTAGFRFSTGRTSINNNSHLDLSTTQNVTSFSGIYPSININNNITPDPSNNISDSQIGGISITQTYSNAAGSANQAMEYFGINIAPTINRSVSSGDIAYGIKLAPSGLSNTTWYGLYNTSSSGYYLNDEGAAASYLAGNLKIGYSLSTTNYRLHATKNTGNYPLVNFGPANVKMQVKTTSTESIFGTVANYTSFPSLNVLGASGSSVYELTQMNSGADNKIALFGGNTPVSTGSGSSYSILGHVSTQTSADAAFTINGYAVTGVAEHILQTAEDGDTDLGGATYNLYGITGINKMSQDWSNGTINMFTGYFDANGASTVGGANATTNYGIFTKAYGGTTNWSIFSDEGEHYFEDGVKIGGAATSPTTALDVDGIVRVRQMDADDAVTIAGYTTDGELTDVVLDASVTLSGGILSASGGGGGGETNTASNLGAGAGVYEQKVTADLQFNSLVSESTSALTIAEDDPNNTIDFTINTGAVADAAATLVTGDQVYDFVVGQGYLTAEVDGSVSNEGSLTVGAGAANTSTIVSNTSGSTAVTIEGGSNVTVTESGSTITIAATGGGATNLGFTGASSPVTLTSDTGNDVTFTQGTGIGLTATGTNITITNSGDTNAADDITGTVASTQVVYGTGANTVASESSFVYTAASDKLSLGNTNTTWDLTVDKDNTDTGIGIVGHSATATQRPVIALARTRGTEASKTTIASGDIIGSITGNGYDGSGYKTTGRIDFKADAAVSAGVVPMSIHLMTGTTEANRAERLTVESSGEIGIGTTAPAAALHMFGNQNSSYQLFIENNSTGSSGASAVVFENSVVGDQAQFFKTGTGYTTYKNIVARDFGIYNAGTAGNLAFLNDFASGEIKFAAGGSSTSQVVIQSDGDVGIGTTSPSQLLHVQKNQNAATAIRVENTTSGTGAEASLALATNGGNYAAFEAFSGAFTTVGLQNTALLTASSGLTGGMRFATLGANPIRFHTNSNGTTNERMVIESGGDVGIGVADALRKLHVAGEMRVTDLTTDAPTQVVGADADGDFGALALSGMSVTGGTLTATDGSVTNELQTVTSTSDATSHTVTLSNTGGSIQLVEGSNITLTTTGTAGDGIVTIASTGGTTDLTFTGASSPYTLNSSTGTDVTITEGEGIGIVRSSNNLTIAASGMTAATGGSAGTAGIVPQPAAGENVEFLRGDATWAAVEYTKNSTIESPGSSENITLFYTRKAITIREVADVARGTTPSVTWQIKYATTRDSGSPTDLFSASRTTTSTSGATTTTFNDATIGAGNWIWLVTSATSGTNDELAVTLTYTID